MSLNLLLFSVICDVVLMVFILINIAMLLTMFNESKVVAHQMHNIHKNCKFRGEKISELYGKVKGS